MLSTLACSFGENKGNARRSWYNSVRKRLNALCSSRAILSKNKSNAHTVMDFGKGKEAMLATLAARYARDAISVEKRLNLSTLVLILVKQRSNARYRGFRREKKESNARYARVRWGKGLNALYAHGVQF
jgi:hypothetical protein